MSAICHICSSPLAAAIWQMIKMRHEHVSVMILQYWLVQFVVFAVSLTVLNAENRVMTCDNLCGSVIVLLETSQSCKVLVSERLTSVDIHWGSPAEQKTHILSSVTVHTHRIQRKFPHCVFQPCLSKLAGFSESPLNNSAKKTKEISLLTQMGVIKVNGPDAAD